MPCFLPPRSGSYLRCTGRQKRQGDCQARDLPALQVEELVITALVRGLSKDVVSEALAREQASRQLTVAPLRKARADLQLRREDLKRQIDALLDLVTEGAMAAKAVGPRLNGIQQEAERVDLEVAELDGRLAAAAMSQGDILTVEETLRLGISAIADQPWSDQKAIIAGLVKKVKIAAGHPLSIEVGVPLALVRTDVREWCAI